MADSLKSKTLYALFWSFLESAGSQGIRFIVGIVLARLLYPEQYGLIGMLMIFMAIAQAFVSSGFGAALIQKKEATQKDICSVFYFNILVAILTAGLLSLLAPWIASFYSQPILISLTRAMSLVIVINSFGLIQSTLLSKRIDFKTQTKVSLISGISSGVIGVAMAAAGFGVWSLVGQQISSALLGTVFLWFLTTWRPALVFSFASLIEMFGFGSKLLASTLLNNIFGNIYSLIVGKVFSATDLGFFTRADSLYTLPSHSLAGMVGRVTFPVFSNIQDDPVRLKNSLRKALTTLVLLHFPMMIGMVVVSRPLVLVLLTEKWSESIPYLQLFCISGLLYPLQLINLNVLQAQGRSDLFLRLEVVKRILVVINITITWRWGISALICGMIVNSFLSYYLNSYYTGVLIDYPIWEQLKDLSSYILMAVLMGLGVYLVGLLPFPNHWTMLLTQIISGILIYISLCWLIRPEAFMELWQTGWNEIRLSGLKAARLQ